MIGMPVRAVLRPNGDVVVRWSGMVVGAIFWIAILVLIVWAITRLVTPHTHTYPASPTPPPASSALEVLKVRYAKGEITKDEFDQMKKDLS